MTNQVIVNPTFRLDVDGKLFKNKNKNSNTDIQETLIFNELMSRLAIFKGDLPLFPDLGLKQHLGKFNFTDESGLKVEITDFENDVENQMNRSCTIDYTLDKINNSVDISFSLEGLEYPLEIKYTAFNGSIKPINYRFKDD